MKQNKLEKQFIKIAKQQLTTNDYMNCQFCSQEYKAKQIIENNTDILIIEIPSGKQVYFYNNEKSKWKLIPKTNEKWYKVSQ